MAIALQELVEGCRAYWTNEPRDAMYRVAMQLVDENRGDPVQMADGLGVVLLTWNQAAYRYGTFAFERLECFLEAHADRINAVRARSIRDFDVGADSADVKYLFNQLLDALKVEKNGRRSPVAAAKALHVLAPSYFPIWDRKIAAGLRRAWTSWELACGRYLRLMQIVRAEAVLLEDAYARGERIPGLPDADSLAAALSDGARRPKTMLKLLDEYYYAKYTGRWV